MSGYNELDDILISLRQRREENEAGESAAPEVPPKAKSRVQRAAEEAERQRLEQERLRKKREEERKAQEEKERKERELREKEMRERLERERKAREEAERERQRKKELERAQLELQHAQWRAAQAKLKEEQERERQKLLEEEAQKEKKEEPTQSKENTKPSKTEDEAKPVNLKKESDKPPIDEPKKAEEQGKTDENKAVNNLPDSLPDDNNTEAENKEEPLSPPKDDKKAAKKAAKRAKLEAELLARRLKAEEKQRKKDEKKRLKKEKQQELEPHEHKDEKSDEDNSESDELNLTVAEKTAENLSTDSVPEPTDKAAEPIEKSDTEDLTENADRQADSDDEEDGFVWYKSVEHKAPKKSIKEKLSPEKIKAGIKKGVNTVFVKPFVFVKEMFRDEIFPAAGRSFKKMLTKQFAIFLAVVVVIGAAGYGGYRLYEYSRVAYLNSYKKEFPGVEFPEGILEEMCGEYGKNQNAVCKISPKDKDEFIVATSDKEENYAYAYPSFDVKNEQQFQSIDVSNVGGFDDIESLYSTRDAFLDSSQMYDLTTLYSKSSYRVIAAFYTNTVATDDAGYVFPYNCYGNMTEKSFRSYVDKIKSRRLYDTGYNFSYDDKFLSISADSDFMPNFKFVVLCVKNTQKNAEKSTTAIDNESVHYPQAWYDKNGETNPYRFSSNWYPEIYTDDNSNTKRLTNKDFQ